MARARLDEATKRRIRAGRLLLAGKTVFAGGPPDRTDPADRWGALEGRKGGELWAFSAENGTKLADYKLESPPVDEGMAAAGGRKAS